MKINQIENDSKNILVNGNVMPAVFVATATGETVRIVSTQRLVPGLSSQGLHYSMIEVNDTVCESANDAVVALNAFIGNFKSGSGGSSGGASPEDASDMITEGTAISAMRFGNKTTYITQSQITVKIDESLTLQFGTYQSLYFSAISGTFNLSKCGLEPKPIVIPPDNIMIDTLSFIQEEGLNLNSWHSSAPQIPLPYRYFIKTGSGSYFKITNTVPDNATGYLEVEKLSM
ncbi:MAG: hypothetical protein LBS69_00160 [Prevotellaceae bacterium]|jgi:hypothetical protein|nr:hypothetical protein [Prevotellaceae bacterium]